MVKLVRKEPENWLPPERVTVLMTRPAKRPYWAEMPEVETVVSSTASSMKRSRGWPRMFSLTTTPLTRKRFSNDMLPEITMLGTRPARGPVSAAAGDSSVACRMLRSTASSSTKVLPKVTEACGTVEIFSMEPVTTISSVTEAIDIAASSLVTWPTEVVTSRLTS